MRQHYFVAKQLNTTLFCRETLKYGTFCRETLKYALWAEKWHKLRCEPTPNFMLLWWRDGTGWDPWATWLFDHRRAVLIIGHFCVDTYQWFVWSKTIGRDDALNFFPGKAVIKSLQLVLCTSEIIFSFASTVALAKELTSGRLHPCQSQSFNQKLKVRRNLQKFKSFWEKQL